jgi:hypothetical protein
VGKPLEGQHALAGKYVASVRASLRALLIG